MTITPTYRRIKNVMLTKGYNFYQNTDSINIVGIRESKSTNGFNDLICVLWIDEEGHERREMFSATTKAGKHWLLNPMNSSGTAILAEGQYKGAYAIGVHNRSRPSKSYQALEQVTSMKYYRDNNLDDMHDYDGDIYEGNFKTNIHRSGITGWSKFVDKWSAGCQVITGQHKLGGTNWERFLQLCTLSSSRYGNSFTYTLLNENDFT